MKICQSWFSNKQQNAVLNKCNPTSLVVCSFTDNSMFVCVICILLSREEPAVTPPNNLFDVCYLGDLGVPYSEIIATKFGYEEVGFSNTVKVQPPTGSAQKI